jgi:hypothetical protein
MPSLYRADNVNFGHAKFINPITAKEKPGYDETKRRIESSKKAAV